MKYAVIKHLVKGVLTGIGIFAIVLLHFYGTSQMIFIFWDLLLLITLVLVARYSVVHPEKILWPNYGFFFTTVIVITVSLCISLIINFDPGYGIKQKVLNDNTQALIFLKIISYVINLLIFTAVKYDNDL